MIADFYDSFQKAASKRVLPAKVLKEVNKTLPRGYHYERNEEGKYFVAPNKGKTSQHFVGDIDYDHCNIPKEITNDQLFEYMYRTQRAVAFKNVKIVEDGKEISFADMYADPISGTKPEVIGSYYMYPTKFPPAPPLELETSSGQKLQIEISRFPYESMDQVKFGNTSFPALTIEFILPEKENKRGISLGAGSIHISATPSKAEKVTDAILSLEIIKEFASGTLKINGTPVGKDINGQAAKLNNDDLENKVRFWLAIYKLEKILQVQFDPREDYPEEDRKFTDELFFNFLDKKDLIFIDPFKHFHIGIKGRNDQKTGFEQLIGKPGTSLAYVGNAVCTLLGAKFDLFVANVLVDLILDNVEMDDDGKGAELYFSDAPGTKLKLVKRYYLTNEEALDNLTRMQTEHAQYKPQNVLSEVADEAPVISEKEFDDVLR